MTQFPDAGGSNVPFMTETGRAGARTSSWLPLERGRVHYLLLCLVVVVGAALRIHELGADSYWIDEVTMVNLASGDVETILEDFRENGRPPVYVWLGRGWIAAFGTSETATRSLSAACGVAAILMLYVIGNQLFGRAVGLISAGLFAVSQLQIAHAQNFRYYSLLVLLSLIACSLYYRALRWGRVRDFAAWVVAGVLLFYTHHFAVFVLAAQTLHFLLVFRRHRPLVSRWIVAQGLLYTAPLLQLLIPFVVQKVIRNQSPGPAWVLTTETSLLVVYRTIRDFLFPGDLPLMLIGGGVVALVATAYWAWTGRGAFRRAHHETVAELRRTVERRDELILVMCWLLVPTVIPFVLSVAIQPMYVPRYMVGASPALYLLAACAIWSARRVLPPILPLALLVLLNAPDLHGYGTPSSAWRWARPAFHEQWREATAYVHAEESDADAILLSPLLVEEAWSWYYRGTLLRCRADGELTNAEALIAALEQCLERRTRVWLVLRNTDLESRFNNQVSELLTGVTSRRGGATVQLRDFHLVRVYRITAERGST